MYAWILKLFGTFLAKSMPSITKTIVEELAHRFKPIEKYVFEDNELDVQVVDIDKKCTDNGFRITAMQGVIKELDANSHPEKPFEESLERVVKYMDEPNECDLKVDALQDAFTSQQREIEEIRKLIKRGK